MLSRQSFLLVLAIVLTLLGTFFLGANSPHIRSVSAFYLSGPTDRRLHFLLPATAPNKQFCKLLLSSGIVGFPEPTLVGWAGHGIYNGTSSHLFKVTETLAYLRSLPAQQDDDLVILLDAYDVFIQLPPDVFIRRYYDVTRLQDDRLRRWGIHNREVSPGVKIKNSVFWGADKVCWPQALTMPACWQIPNSTWDAGAFGPDTDTNIFKNRPRWLNSGTLIGPVKDIREVFAATVSMISRRFDEGYERHGSDQYYFAEVWAEQESRRMEIRDGSITKFRPESIIQEVDADSRTEYGISVDYETDIFLANCGFERVVSWMRYNHSASGTVEPQPGKSRRPDQFALPQDILDSQGPFDAIDASEDIPQPGWNDVMLGSNMAQGKPFPLLHMTGDKSVIDRWWPRLWFHPHAEALLRAKKKQQAHLTDPNLLAVIDGVKWKSTPPPRAHQWDRAPMTEKHPKGGVWTDHGDFVPFEELCAEFEQSDLYVEPEGGV